MIDREELVEKMCEADCDAPAKNYPRQTPWRAMNDKQREDWRSGMDAALSVAVDELLKEPTAEEMTTYWHIDDEHEKWRRNYFYSGKKIINSRRAQLERVKTPEERVTIFDNDKHLGENFTPLWVVQLDGNNVLHMEKMCFSRENAEIYRLGLIAQLKGSA